MPKTIEPNDTCPNAASGQHVPDVLTVTVTFDGADAYFDVNCALCGQSGCAGKFDSELVDW